jgi:hypothetical protein
MCKSQHRIKSKDSCSPSKANSITKDLRKRYQIINSKNNSKND